MKCLFQKRNNINILLLGDLRYEAIWEAYVIGNLLKQLKRVDKVHSFAEDN